MSTPITLLTLSHQYGSGGSLIARDLGQRLNWKVWDKEIVQTIASQQHVSEDYIETKDERVGSFIERIVESFGVGGFESAYNIPPPLRLKDSQLARLTRTLIEQAAQEGSAIIVGRGGNCILAAGPRPCMCLCLPRSTPALSASCTWRASPPTRAKRRITGMDNCERITSTSAIRRTGATRTGIISNSTQACGGRREPPISILQALEHHTQPVRS